MEQALWRRIVRVDCAHWEECIAQAQGSGKGGAPACSNPFKMQQVPIMVNLDSQYEEVCCQLGDTPLGRSLGGISREE